MHARSSTRAALAACVLVCALAAAHARVLGEIGVRVHEHEPRTHAHAPLGPVKSPKPLIGILTQPCETCPGRSYVAAAYVKFVEMAGARAVPIRFYASDAELHRLFKRINGLIFAGGLTWLWLDSPYVIAARKLFNWAVESNDAGSPFPIWGTCLGHQLLHILVSNVSRDVLLVETDAVAHATNLEFTPAAKASKLFSGLPADLYAKVEDASNPLAAQNHMYGVPPDHYTRWPILQEFFSVLTLTNDRTGKPYSSTVEARNYPFFGTQWHPEKTPFEFSMDSVPHNLDTVRLSQHLANVFVDTARRSSNSPESREEELDMLIYVTPPTFSAAFEVFDEDNYDGPDMTYYFDQKPVTPHGPDDEEVVSSDRRVPVRKVHQAA